MELEVYSKQGFGHSSGIGARPALVLVDFTVGFCDPAHFGGGNIEDAARASAALLTTFRELGLPVAHTRIVYAEDGSDLGVWVIKVPALAKLTENSEISQTISPLAAVAGELVVRKQHASAFAGTGFNQWLSFNRVDTLVVVGCTTSGCVRATVVDAISQNLRVIVPPDCVGDRAIGPHEANLFDIQQKYADLIPSAELIADLKRKGSA
jgi:maleamate amidohydrolase